jgi:hypothetical protein
VVPDSLRESAGSSPTTLSALGASLTTSPDCLTTMIGTLQSNDQYGPFNYVMAPRSWQQIQLLRSTGATTNFYMELLAGIRDIPQYHGRSRKPAN